MQRRLLNDRYELHEQLGQGGMATVYRATDIRLGRQVAVKLLHGQYATDVEFRQRFEHEAQAAAGLSAHPNIVDVYDVGQDADVPYIVMELIEGSDLKTIIDSEGPLTIERSLLIAQQAAEGLEYAHTRGLIHRDIKPQNIMVSSDGMVRITDFGIAKSLQSTAVTQAGITYGTADYIAPEQAQGLPALPQTDVYSLGVVVYEMLTRHLPFTGDSPMAVAVQHIQQPPPPLSQWNPTLPPSLSAIVMSALAKDPRARPASARAFASALREYRTSRGQQTMVVPVVPRQPPVTSPQPATPPVRLRREEQTAPMRVAPTPAQRERARRPAPVPAPPPLARPAQQRGGGIGAFLLGLLLLGGLLGLAYVAFATDALNTLFTPAPPIAAEPTAEPTTSPTPAPTNTALVLVRVPDYVNRPESEVRQDIEESGFVLGFIGDAVANAAPAGTVFQQEPPPNTEVAQGSEIRIRVSLGPEATPTPEVTPTTEPSPTTAPSPTTEPSPTTAPSPTPARLNIPELAGRPFEAVRTALEAAGFVVEQQVEPSRSVPAGVVISQSPPPGDLDVGTTIRLVVSQGDVVVFPNVVGLDRAAAEAELQRADGLTLQLVDEQGPDRLANFDSIPPNQVVSATANDQPVQNGDLIPRGSRIIIGVRRP